MKRLVLVFFLTFFAIAHGQMEFPKKEQDTTLTKKSFRIRAYKPIYFLFNYSDRMNENPTSDNPNNVVTNGIPLDHWELKFQLSFKTKAFNIGKGGGLWVAYTQSSRWQIFNTDQSRPFRENNYEPEIFFTFLIDANEEKRSSYYWGIGLNHQSNGRSLPYSRSWNRFIGQLGYQSDDFSVLLRPWLRWQEKSVDDDNRGIENYVGRFDLTTAYKKGRSDLSLSVRHSLNFRNQSRGSLRFDYSFTAWGYFKFHAQLFHGYGENLLDFNHKQTTFGLGLSLVNWLDKF
jgi:phospholipase A1